MDPHMYDNDLTPDSVESLEEETWISEFCSVSGREIFVEVPEEFIEDDFNLTGLSHFVTYYREALELILDLEPEDPMQLANMSIVENSAENLYGLIHARYLTSRQGIHAMAHKYDYGVFGTCPRLLCNSMKLLPTGRHDLPGVENLRLFCPCCLDIYHPQSSRHAGIDGAFFGTSFVGLFLKTFPSIEQECIELRKKQFSLTIYGFKISEFSNAGPRMKWLRRVPQNEYEIEELERDQNDSTNEDEDDDEDEDEFEDDSLSEDEDEANDDDDDEEEDKEEQKMEEDTKPARQLRQKQGAK
ncbi:uncharacterized protein SAPINGB_P004140 [Magnusiomyces paraingens]|uniref:Casein kinase II subunit beta n=1 Tax=Magnusiomyces paraingens TaxID=2606893 RepID=A0A5E8BYD4_9ASCO|nr:uncharacterized protein SAPINGB_P004140 [Saprochaete ingens]VVT54567.1 unnamed protein product [Saprochaete ingens]